MTTDSFRPGLHPLSQLKAGPTTSSSKSTAVPASSTHPPPQASSRPQLSKNPSRDEHINATSEKATIGLIRRVLCPQAAGYGGATSPYPPKEVLPPLTSSNDVDRELYALIAIVIKEFVSSWYSKITSDQSLINEVLQIIAHCTRALEQRLRETDIAQLVLDEIPALVETHIASYRLAKEHTSLSGFSPSSREIYHALNPHPGLSPVPDPSDPQALAQQRKNETIYRQLLVHGALAVLLPTEDLENSCLRILVGDILADLVLGNQVSGKVCEGWFLWGAITKLLDALASPGSGSGEGSTATRPVQKTRLQVFGLVSPKGDQSGHSLSSIQSQASNWVWQILHYIYLVYVTLQYIVVGLFRIASTPVVASTSGLSPSASLVDGIPTPSPPVGKRPVLDYRLYGTLSQLLDLPRRMPWLGGFLALFQYLILAGPGKLGGSGKLLDRFLHETIEDYVLPPTLLPNILLATRETLFPQNARPRPLTGVNRTLHTTEQQHLLSNVNEATGVRSAGSSTPTAPIAAPDSPLSPDRRPSDPEISAIRRKCAVTILSLIPLPIARRLLGIPEDPLAHTPVDSPKHPTGSCEKRSSSTEPASPPLLPYNLFTTNGDVDEEALLLETIEKDILDLFADEYCNKHLIYSIVETILAKIIPELSDRSIVELMEDRGVSLVHG